MNLCTDNAVMIAAAGTRLLSRGVRDGLDLEAFSRVPIGESPWRERDEGLQQDEQHESGPGKGPVGATS